MPITARNSARPGRFVSKDRPDADHHREDDEGQPLDDLHVFDLHSRRQAGQRFANAVHSKSAFRRAVRANGLALDRSDFRRGWHAPSGCPGSGSRCRATWLPASRAPWPDVDSLDRFWADWKQSARSISLFERATLSPRLFQSGRCCSSGFPISRHQNIGSPSPACIKRLKRPVVLGSASVDVLTSKAADRWRWNYIAPFRPKTAGIVFKSTATSCQKVQLLTYQTSSWTRRAYVVLLRPLTCQRPVRPGRVA